MMFSEFDKSCMQLALAQAQLSAEAGEVPVGAVLTLNNKVVAKAHNQPIGLTDPTAHAEILVLRQAAQLLKNYRLIDSTLYVTLEPCQMCMGAITHARIKRLVYAASDERDQKNHFAQCEHGLFAEESSSILKAFFKARR